MERASKHILVLQHCACEELGTIGKVLKQIGVAPHYIRSFEGQSVPKEIGDGVGLIVLGGPQSAYDQGKHPFLRDEINLIEHALNHEKPVLGVCLGSQLLAATLGATVYPGRRKEIGWNRVTLTEACCSDSVFTGIPQSFTAFHWHGDIFDLPRGTIPLASSPVTPNQAFRYAPSAYGLLFHLEVSLPQVRNMVEVFADELRVDGLNGTAIKLNAHSHLSTLQQIGHTVFSRWAAFLR
jgi:GMP synthase (glutamine-hydrolysing)